MDMHVGRRVQAAGMGVQQRHQALQQGQQEDQEIFFEMNGHACILNSNACPHQSSRGLASPGVAG